jgi:hypothetical protein
MPGREAAQPKEGVTVAGTNDPGKGEAGAGGRAHLASPASARFNAYPLTLPPRPPPISRATHRRLPPTSLFRLPRRIRFPPHPAPSRLPSPEFIGVVPRTATWAEFLTADAPIAPRVATAFVYLIFWCFLLGFCFRRLRPHSYFRRLGGGRILLRSMASNYECQTYSYCNMIVWWATTHPSLASSARPTLLYYDLLARCLGSNRLFFSRYPLRLASPLHQPSLNSVRAEICHTTPSPPTTP